MKLFVRHTFECTPERFWEMYWDPGFDAALGREAAVMREVLEERTEGRVVVRRVRFTPDRELPGPVAALIGAKKLVYEQENRWDPDSGKMSWKVIPTVLPGKLEASGQFFVRGITGGCEQIVEGDITVNVRFIGGQIEKSVVAEVERSYDRTAAICREWLRNNAT